MARTPANRAAELFFPVLMVNLVRMQEEIYDVAIVGGGPAGSTAAALLARAGRRVVVFERDRFPRFHIGESLLPFSMKAFTRLGLHEKFLRAGFMEKFGGEMCGACSEKGVKFYFKDGYGSQTDRSYQVTRAEFDKVLLDHARENGAEVREETGVDRIEFGAGEVGITWKATPKEKRLDATAPANGEIRARYVIDASGRNSIVGNLFKLKKNYDHLQKLSIFAHFDGVEREPGIDGTLTRMVRGIDRWFWMIPLTAERMSIGIVLDAEIYRRSGRSPEDFFEEAIAEQPLIAERMLAGRRVSPVSVAADFSYRNTQLTGERWLLAGDAAGFIDPVFSSGVFLAVLAGEQAADALDVVLDRPEKRRKLFARYEKTGEQGDGCLSAICRCVVFQGVHRSLSQPDPHFPNSPGGERGFGRKHWNELCHPVENGGFLLHRVVAALRPGLSAAHARAGKTRDIGSERSGRGMNRTLRSLTAAVSLVFLAGCGTTATTSHKFAEPTPIWKTRAGQLLYAGPKMKMAGDLLVRYSAAGDLELTFSKGPGVTLLDLRQDATFAQINGPLARGGWAGETPKAPEHLRGWLSLRKEIIQAGLQRSVRKKTATETFLIMF